MGSRTTSPEPEASMVRKGPAPRPTKLKLLHGERHQSRLNHDEPTPRPADMPEPDDASPAVLEVWRRVVRELEAMNLAFPADYDALRCYCEAVVQHRKASDVLARTGVLIKGLHGGFVRNPACQDTRAARRAGGPVRSRARRPGVEGVQPATPHTGPVGRQAVEAGPVAGRLCDRPGVRVGPVG